MRLRTQPCVTCALAALVVSLNAQTVIKETVPGITNFARVEKTIACAGAITPEAVSALKAKGYASIINLREASEPGADIDGEAAAAKVAGITFIHIPFNGVTLSPALVDRFLTAVIAPANQPVFVHDASANRAAAMWMIKRIKVDNWAADRAGAEATALGLTSTALRSFALQYAQAQK
jgi:uncharacterized protein (TIGR01244 family)